MSIFELIEELKRFPPDMRVVVQGYEDGFDDIATIDEVRLCLDVNDEWWDGPYEEAEPEKRFDEIALRLMGRRRLQPFERDVV